MTMHSHDAMASMTTTLSPWSAMVTEVEQVAAAGGDRLDFVLYTLQMVNSGFTIITLSPLWADFTIKKSSTYLS